MGDQFEPTVAILAQEGLADRDPGNVHGDGELDTASSVRFVVGRAPHGAQNFEGSAVVGRRLAVEDDGRWDGCCVIPGNDNVPVNPDARNDCVSARDKVHGDPFAGSLAAR